jgi:hypothetical protein
MLSRQHGQLAHSYNRIYEDTQLLNHALERKHHDVNLLKSKLAEIKQGILSDSDQA